VGQTADVRRLWRYDITTSLLHVLQTPSLTEGAVIVQVDIRASEESPVALTPACSSHTASSTRCYQYIFVLLLLRHQNMVSPNTAVLLSHPIDNVWAAMMFSRQCWVVQYPAGYRYQFRWRRSCPS